MVLYFSCKNNRFTSKEGFSSILFKTTIIGELPPKLSIGTVSRALGAVQLAVVLILVLAAVLAWATFLEAGQGREYAQWHVYKSYGFIALLAMLGTNILVATAIRFPWRQHKAFLVTHAGLLLLLGGSIQTFLGGKEGLLTLSEGETANSILLSGRLRIAFMLS